MHSTKTPYTGESRTPFGLSRYGLKNLLLLSTTDTGGHGTTETASYLAEMEGRSAVVTQHHFFLECRWFKSDGDWVHAAQTGVHCA